MKGYAMLKIGSVGWGGKRKTRLRRHGRYL